MTLRAVSPGWITIYSTVAISLVLIVSQAPSGSLAQKPLLKPWLTTSNKSLLPRRSQVITKRDGHSQTLHFQLCLIHTLHTPRKDLSNCSD